MLTSKNQNQEKTLLEKITETLQTQKLTNRMQKELALLLLLRSILEEKKSSKNTQKIKIVDLAILSLLQHQELDETNKIFIQKIRRKLDFELPEPNPFWALIKGHGGSYNRLISGLTWYFILFVASPLAIILGIFFYGVFTQEKLTSQDFIKLVDNQKKQRENSSEIINILQGTLKDVASLTSEEDTSSESSNQEKDIPKLQLIKNKSESALEKTEKKNKELLKNQLEENRLVETTTNETSDNLESINAWFLEQDYLFIFLAIIMGALGSITSIIVRSQEFIQKSEDEEKDLFFVGFLRPFVGMSFAILVVSIIESGIFLSISGVPENSINNERRERTSSTLFYYMAIAFIAGFSERFVQGLVLKVENSNDIPKQLKNVDSRLQKIEEQQRNTDNYSRQQEFNQPEKLDDNYSNQQANNEPPKSEDDYSRQQEIEEKERREEEERRNKQFDDGSDIN